MGPSRQTSVHMLKTVKNKPSMDNVKPKKASDIELVLELNNMFQ